MGRVGLEHSLKYAYGLFFQFLLQAILDIETLVF